MARTPSKPDDQPESEAIEEVRKQKAVEKSGGQGRTRTLVTGAAIGIGSAALVAALLYANRSRKADKKD